MYFPPKDRKDLNFNLNKEALPCACFKCYKHMRLSKTIGTVEWLTEQRKKKGRCLFCGSEKKLTSICCKACYEDPQTKTRKKDCNSDYL